MDTRLEIRRGARGDGTRGSREALVPRLCENQGRSGVRAAAPAVVSSRDGSGRRRDLDLEEEIRPETQRRGSGKSSGAPAREDARAVTIPARQRRQHLQY